MLRVCRLVSAACGLVVLLTPGYALAWEAETHRAILELALRLSPAAEARIPAEYRDELLKELHTPDSRDTLCRYHRGPSARVDAFAEAEREFAFLTQAQPALRPYPRAKAMGRYLHWVADSVVPAPIAAGKVYAVTDFWPNKDFVVFREKSPLGLPLAASLRSRAEEAAWAMDTPASLPSILRKAVNTTIEALLILPPANDGSAVTDDGPVIFIVNRIDTGLSGMRSNLYYYETYQNFGGGYAVETAGITEIRTGGQGQKKADMMQRRQVQVVEQSSRRRPDGGTTIRALVFNNTSVPACQAALSSGKWISAATGTLPSGAVQVVAFDIPPGIDGRALKLTSRTSDCPDTISPAVVRTEKRIVLGNTGGPPRLEAERASKVLGAPAGDRSVAVGDQGARPVSAGATVGLGTRSTGQDARSIVVALKPPAAYGLSAPVEVRGMEVVPGPFEWKVEVTLRRLRESPLGQLRLILKRTDATGDDVEECVWVDAKRLAYQATQKFFVTHKPRRASVPKGLQLIDIGGGA